VYYLICDRLIFQTRKAWFANSGILDSGNLNEEDSNKNFCVMINEGKLGLIKFTISFNDTKKVKHSKKTP